MHAAKMTQRLSSSHGIIVNHRERRGHGELFVFCFYDPFRLVWEDWTVVPGRLPF